MRGIASFASLTKSVRRPSQSVEQLAEKLDTPYKIEYRFETKTMTQLKHGPLMPHITASWLCLTHGITILKSSHIPPAICAPVLQSLRVLNKSTLSGIARELLLIGAAP